MTFHAEEKLNIQHKPPLLHPPILQASHLERNCLDTGSQQAQTHKEWQMS